MNTRIILTALLLSVFISVKAQKKDTITDDMDDYVEQATINQYLIVAGSSNNYLSLKKFAGELSKKSGIQYSDLERVYKNGCIALSDTSADELYRGVYVFRRWEPEVISIELKIDGIMFSPSETKERPLMIIVAGSSSNKKEAEEKLKLIKKFVPTAYLLKKEVYMGCMH